MESILAILTRRELNRATRSRQLLLARDAMPVPAAIERLVALQAQLPIPPYIGLWSRLSDFRREALADLIDARAVVRATFLRGTLHLFTAGDYLRFRSTIQPVLSGGAEARVKQRGADLDVAYVLSAAKAYLAEAPRTFAEITAWGAELLPDTDPGAIRYTIRMNIPLIQLPTDTPWRFPGNPKFTLAETWLGKPMPTEDNLRTLICRYLAAFGPASVTDIQTWSGLDKLKAVVEALKPALQVYRDETKRELFDLPDMPLPDADTPAPVRFLPEFDNLLLGHSNRSRIIADEYRSRVYLPGLRVRATFLVDGFVHGAWKVEKTKLAAALIIEPFAALTASQRESLTAEADQLIRFIEPEAKAFEVRFADPAHTRESD